jgi:hypothetical protein
MENKWVISVALIAQKSVINTTTLLDKALRDHCLVTPSSSLDHLLAPLKIYLDSNKTQAIDSKIY